MDGTEHEYAEEMRCVAEFALEKDMLTGAAQGIAKQVIDKGWQSLTPRQQEVFTQIAVPATSLECKRCGNDIEPFELGLGGEYCGWCDKQMAKDD